MKKFLLLALAFCVFTQEAKAQDKATQKSSWDHLDVGKAKVMDGFIRIEPESPLQDSFLQTKESFTGPIEIVVVARTEHDNIRLHAFNGACVIFNWEVNRAELRVHRPDGNERQASGSIATAAVRPLDANTWYTLRWRVTKEGMEVFVNGKLVFSEKRTYNLWEKCPVMVRSWKRSIVDVKSFDVKSIQGKEEIAQKQKEEPGKTKDDKALLQGRWFAIEEETEGKTLSKDGIATLNKILDVTGDDFRIERGAVGKRVAVEGKMTLGQTDSPKAFHFEGKAPSGQRIELQGVYDVSDNMFKLCYSLVPAGEAYTRPVEFRTFPGSKRIYVTFKRSQVKGDDNGVGDRAVAALLAELKDNNPEVRRDAAIFLAAIRPLPKTTIPALTVALKDKTKGFVLGVGTEAPIRMFVATALGNIGPDAKDAVPALTEALVDDPSFDVRVRCVFALQQIGDAGVPGLVKGLEQSMQSSSSVVRQFAACCLAERGGKAKETVPQLEKAMKAEKDDNTRIVMAACLFRIEPDNKAILSTLIEVLEEGTGFMRGRAAGTVILLGSRAKPALPSLEKLTRSNDEIEANTARYAIRLIKAGELPSSEYMASAGVPEDYNRTKDRIESRIIRTKGGDKKQPFNEQKEADKQAVPEELAKAVSAIAKKTAFALYSPDDPRRNLWGEYTVFAINPDGITLASQGHAGATGGVSGEIRLWNLSSAKEIKLPEERRPKGFLETFSPDGTALLMSTGDRSTIVCDSKSLKFKARFERISGRLVWSSDGKRIIAADGYDDTLTLWDVSTGQEKEMKKARFNGLRTIAWSKDGNVIACGLSDGKVVLWDTNAWKVRATLSGHDQGIKINALAFSNDGGVLASASDDNTVVLWDVPKALQMHSLRGHTKGVRSVAFSPDDKLVVSGGEQAIVWHVKSGRKLGTLNDKKYVDFLAFADGGRLLVTACGYGVTLWEVPALGKK